MADKRMLKLNGEWVDLAKVIHCWFTDVTSNSGPYWKFYFILEGVPKSNYIPLTCEEKEQFEEHLEKTWEDFTTICIFEYKKPESKPEPEPEPKPKSKPTGYFKNSGVPQ